MPRAKPVTPLDEGQRARVVENLGIAKSVAAEYAWQASCPADQDDLFGAAALGLCRAATSFDPKSGRAFHPYAFAVCRRHSLKELLGRRRRLADWGGDDDLTATVDRQPGPVSLVEWHEAEAAIHALPPRQRRAIELTMEGHGRGEIAAELGITREGVRRIQRRTVERLMDSGLLT